MRSNRNIQFVGNWSKIQDMMDADKTPEDMLQSTPEVLTLERYFRNMI